MKKWETPSIAELDISKTEHRLFGQYSDGGYIGDGILSGHSSWDKPSDPEMES